MEKHAETAFRRRNDFYYITLLVYVVFAVAYILITGTVTDETVEFGFRDPVVYIIGLFILYAAIMLVVNIVRAPRLVFTEDSLVFRSRFKEKTIPFSAIRVLILRRERPRFNEGTHAVAKIKIAGRRRGFRIRMSKYERENEMHDQFTALEHKIAGRR